MAMAMMPHMKDRLALLAFRLMGIYVYELFFR